MVNISFTNKVWRQANYSSRQALTLAQRLSLPEILAQVLVARGLYVDDAAQYLDPKLKTSLPDPYHLHGMQEAVSRLVQAIQANERVVVWGDYDVDGATSTSLLLNYFSAIGFEVGYYIPDRQRDGYGPNALGLEQLAADGTTLVITVDCGVTAFAPLEIAQKAGLDVLVIDHHLGEETLPPAVAVVNPNRRDQESPCKNLAAVGVCFLVLVALNTALAQQGFFNETRQKPELQQFLDIVALGTVADVVPLTGLNRAFVAQGLKVMASQRNEGLKALMTVANMNSKPSAYHCGFLLGPRINAGGRVGLSSLGTQLLTCTDPIQAKVLAQQLDNLNRERQTLEQQVLEAALAQAAKTQDASIIITAGEGWHEGVIGIVAGRLKEKYGRPALCLSIHNGMAKGSGRSALGLHLGNIILAAKAAGLLTAGGGHAAAAGFSLPAENIPAFTDFCQDAVVKAALPAPSLEYDAPLPLAMTTLFLVGHLEAMAPFGMGNPQPRFLLGGVRLGYMEPVGKGHLRVMLEDPLGSSRVSAMIFRAEESGLMAALMARRGALVDVLVTLKRDEWQGRERLGVTLEDVRLAAGLNQAAA
jgi:single-stranded-DNA-specific exonuclease